MDRIKVERAIGGLTEWRKHVQTNSDIDRDISTAIEALNAQLSQEGTTSDIISRQAVKHLDLFTKTYCRDKSVKDDLIFRCNQCDFRLPDGICLVKTMAGKLCPDYREFGSMGDL